VGTVLELYTPEALNTQSTCPFKGNMDTRAGWKRPSASMGPENVAFVRMEATTNLIGGSFLARQLA
jgi:tryptophanase